MIFVAARDPRTADPYQAVSLYLVDGDTPGLERGRRLKKMGMHSQTNEIMKQIAAKFMGL